jgi:hypothetical protein
MSRKEFSIKTEPSRVTFSRQIELERHMREFGDYSVRKTCGRTLKWTVDRLDDILNYLGLEYHDISEPHGETRKFVLQKRNNERD